MKSNMASTILAIWIGFLVQVGTGLADEVEDVDQMVRDTVGKTLLLLSQKDLTDAARRDQILEVIRPAFDFELMAMLTVGKKHWTRMGAEQRTEFTALLVDSLERSYLDKIELFSNERVEYGKPTPIGKKKIAADTWVISKTGRVSIRYKLYKKATDWKVYDVEVEKVSIVSAYRSQYRDILRSGTVDALLKRMREQAETS